MQVYHNLIEQLQYQLGSDKNLRFKLVLPYYREDSQFMTWFVLILIVRYHLQLGKIIL